MSINLTVPEPSTLKPQILVIGVGGAGGNAVGNMIAADLQGVEFVAANTDAQALCGSPAERKIQMGLNITQGLGAGSKPEVGRAAAEEAMDMILEHLSGTHMVFVTAGMGGGTGTGAAPIIAQAARENGVLTVGVVTKPFQFEGQRRMAIAEQGIEELQKHVDTLIVIPNQNLFRIATDETTFADAFAMADEVLHSGVRGVTDLMVMPGLINLDFADVKTVMAEMGKAVMGTGEAEGEDRATEAALAAISNPLLDEVSIKGAQGVLVNITGGPDMKLHEVDRAADCIGKEVDAEANIIVGSTFNEVLEGRMRVSVVATGIDAEAVSAPYPVAAAPLSEVKTTFQHDPATPAEPAIINIVEPTIVGETAPFGGSEEETPDRTAATLAKELDQVEPLELTEEVTMPEPPAKEAEPKETPRTDSPFIAPAPMEVKTSHEAPKKPDAFAEAAVANSSQPRKRSLFSRVTGGGKAKAKQLAQAAVAKPEPAPAKPAEPAVAAEVAEKPAAARVRLFNPTPARPAPEPAKPAESDVAVTAEDRLAQPLPEEDQLEIPAFLRRQAN